MSFTPFAKRNFYRNICILCHLHARVFTYYRVCVCVSGVSVVKAGPQRECLTAAQGIFTDSDFKAA